MRLLVFTPTYTLPDGSDAMCPESAESVRSQQVDCNLEYVIGRHNPYPAPSHRNVLAQFQQAQAMFLQEGYDALLTVEHDNVLPDPGAIQRLLDTPGDVVYAPYLLRHGVAVLSTWQYCGDKNLGQSLTLHPDELAQARKAVVWRVCGVGHGCTLFRRHVLEHIQFRGGEGEQYAPDIPFAQDALRAGYISMGRFDVPVLHKQNLDWLDPYKGLATMRYYCRVTVNALTPDGTRYRLIEGEYIDIPPGQAYDLARAGFVTVPDRRHWDGPLEPETATAEPDAERAVLPKAKRRRVA